MSGIHFNFSQRNQEEKRTVKLSCDYVKQSQIQSLVKKKKTQLVSLQTVSLLDVLLRTQVNIDYR